MGDRSHGHHDVSRAHFRSDCRRLFGTRLRSLQRHEGRRHDRRRIGIPASIKLTPETIVIPEGSRAVKSLSEHGTTVTLDGAASGASDIKACQ